MKIFISDIGWDTDGIFVDDLPENVIIDNTTEDMIEEVLDDGYAEDIGDYLSDTYGYCVTGFATEIMEDNDE